MNLIPHIPAGIPARRFVMYLPDADRLGYRIPNIEEWVREACLLLVRLNGGATRLPPAQGLWFNEADQCLVSETTHIVFSCVTGGAFFQQLHLVRSFIERFAKESNQDSVAIEFDGSIFFISGDAIAAPERQLDLA